jgi:hypothetical protein
MLKLDGSGHRDASPVASEGRALPALARVADTRYFVFDGSGRAVFGVADDVDGATGSGPVASDCLTAPRRASTACI